MAGLIIIICSFIIAFFGYLDKNKKATSEGSPWGLSKRGVFILGIGVIGLIAGIANEVITMKSSYKEKQQVEATDQSIGEIIALLEARGLAKEDIREITGLFNIALEDQKKEIIAQYDILIAEVIEEFRAEKNDMLGMIEVVLAKMQEQGDLVKNLNKETGHGKIPDHSQDEIDTSDADSLFAELNREVALLKTKPPSKVVLNQPLSLKKQRKVTEATQESSEDLEEFSGFYSRGRPLSRREFKLLMRRNPGHIDPDEL